jgi:hypothetical protein
MSERRRRGGDDASRNAATCLAMIALMMCGLGFLAFAAVVLPQVRGAILVVGGMFVFILLHYLTWGHWMSRMRDSEDDEVPPGPDDY